MSSSKEHSDTNSDSKSLDQLVQIYVQKIAELEERENEVLKQVEVLQSTVAELQGRRESEDSKTEYARPRTGLINVEEVEKETQKIREETERIQMEIMEKIAENKRLQEELDSRHALISSAGNSSIKSEGIETEKQAVETWIKNILNARKSRSAPPDPPVPSRAIESGIKFFSEKLEKLQRMEMNLKRASLEESELAKIRQMKLKEKVEMLEWETQVDRQLIDALRRKYGKN